MNDIKTVSNNIRVLAGSSDFLDAVACLSGALYSRSNGVNPDHKVQFASAVTAAVIQALLKD